MPIDLQLLRKDDEKIVRDWFKDHVVLHFETYGADKSPITRLVWSKPKEVWYRIYYIWHGGWLFVAGDLGEAVYQWNSELDLSFLAMCDLSYFGGKCQASSQEPKGKTWDRDRVQAQIEEWLKEWAEENPVDCPKCSTYTPGQSIEETPEDEDAPCSLCKGKEVVPRPALTFEECKDLMFQEDCVDLDDVIGHAHAWGQFMYEGEGLIVSTTKVPVVRAPRYYDGQKTEYPRWKLEDCYNVGYTWDLRTRAHLEGLKMAWKQLQEKCPNPCPTCGQYDPPRGTCHCGAR